jgi:hypothetical protein
VDARDESRSSTTVVEATSGSCVGAKALRSRRRSSWIDGARETPLRSSRCRGGCVQGAKQVTCNPAPDIWHMLQPTSVRQSQLGSG